MITLTTERLRLVPLGAQIVELRMQHDDFRHEGVHYPSAWPGDLLTAFTLWQANPTPWTGQWVIVEGSEAVGAVGLMSPSDDPIPEIGYGVNPTATGRGIATEAVSAVVEYLRSTHHAGVMAQTSASNPASARVLSKAGFTQTASHESDDGLMLSWHQRF